MSELNITRVPQFLDPWFTEIEQVWDEIEASVNDIETRVQALEAGGSSTWGAITGTLADQTDLQTALDAKVVKVQADNYRLMATNGSATITEAAAITAAKALKSDANGIPTHFDTSVEPSITELQKVKGVTSAIQTQLNAKAANALSGSYAAAAGTVAIADTLEQAVQKLDGNIAALSAPLATFYKFTMTGDVYSVGGTFSNAAGGGLAQVGNGTSVPYVQCTGVVISATTDIIDIGFSALCSATSAADLLLGYQIGSNTPVWGNYISASKSPAFLNISTNGITPGTYTIKLMACRAGPGGIDIVASDSTAYGIQNIPAGAILTVKVSRSV